MATKRKADEPPADEPAEEKAEGEQVPKEEEPKEEAAAGGKEDGAPEDGEAKAPAKPKEAEEDATPDSRTKVTGTVGFNAADMTLNAMQTAGGKLLAGLSDGGMQHLVAGVRGNVGLKAGRYMFEVMIVGDRQQKPDQQQQQQNQQQQQGKVPSQQVVRVGFAAAGSSLILGDGQENVCFDSEGIFIHGKTKKRASQKFSSGQVVAVVLNLDSASPNFNTVSLFRNGTRASQPQPLPEGLLGKPLFPAVSYRGALLRVSFEDPPMKSLPFKCRKLQDAAQEDVEVVAPVAPEGGRFEVVFPVGLPEEGPLDWVDDFLEKNPNYVELSNRAILDWASRSGLTRKTVTKGCNDRPEMGFGIPQLDDLSVAKVLASVAPEVGRNYVVVEVKGNLLAEARRAAAARFPDFKKSAVVLMGEPPAEQRERAQAALLREKRAKAEAKSLAERTTRSLHRLNDMLEAELKRKKAEAERKRLVEAKRLKAKAEGDVAKTEADEEKDGDNEIAEDVAEEVIVELSEEEKKRCFRKRPLLDMLPSDLAKSFTKFSIPEAAEGFDEVRFGWQAKEKCAEHLREWVLTRKLTQRVEDIQPSKWFKDKSLEWQKLLTDWKKKQSEWKKVLAQLQEWKKEGTTKKGSDEEGEDKPTEIDADDIDVFSVKNVADIGSGEPLFAKFEYEDWTLISLRVELHLLLHGFRKDIDDPERLSFHESHLGFYYNRYFRKALDIKLFGVSSPKDLCQIIKDTAAVKEFNGIIESLQDEDTPMDSFVKLTEEHRRDRQRRLDAGDETAELKFKQPSLAAKGGQGQLQRSNQKAPLARAAGGPQPPKYAPAQGSYGASQPPRSQYQPAATRTQPSGGSGSGQKRPFVPASYAAKQARTSYGGSYGSYGSQGGRW
mmetsp:Transcript_29746/g.85358  ORF Transcript_29746/g.85358 Transcript_29746/m.85358 type:complete len:889 (-) Transcript_29746:58-2724(-)